MEIVTGYAKRFIEEFGRYIEVLNQSCCKMYLYLVEILKNDNISRILFYLLEVRSLYNPMNNM